MAICGVVRSDTYSFTYKSNVALKKGLIVRVPVGKKIMSGIVIDKVSRPSFKTKLIGSVVSPHSIPTELLETAHWIANYYAIHPGLVMQTLLPAGITKKRRKTSVNQVFPERKRTKILLNTDQSSAVEKITQGKSQTFLLHGVTGSGKTNVYIESIKSCIKNQKSAILLVPEISLTPQLVAELANHFSNLVVTHSGLSEAERHNIWQKVLESNSPIVIVGPRSALFMPVNNLGLVIIDECHEPTYKQDSSPKYSALRVASILAKNHKAKLVLGSATPSIADFYLATNKQIKILSLPRPISGQHSVIADIIDLRKKENLKKHRFLSDKMLSAIEQTLQNKKQVLLFHNRRGTAPTTICSNCSWTAECKNCFLPLTLHADKHSLICHLCQKNFPTPPSCPQCGQPTIIFKGIGTKMVESEIKKLFPKVVVSRFDTDTTKEESFHTQYQQIYDQKVDIIIGTQQIAKGLDLPGLGMVGVIQADSGLALPDFNSEERVFQLLCQVVGRVGRTHNNAEVVVQTFQPENPVIQLGVNRDYLGFYEQQIVNRQKTKFPPFRFLLKLICSYKTERSAILSSQKLASALAKNSAVEILGPAPAFYERLGGNYRWQIILKATSRAELVKICRNLPQGWQYDLDPHNIL